MVVVMAGLPGTGKSTIAARVAAAVGGVVLSKDAVRAALFPPPALDYSRTQDDIAMSAVYEAAGVIVPGRPVVIDGRTFTKAYQVRDLLDWAATIGEVPAWVECVCPDDVARERLERGAGSHPAGNRTFALYLRMKAAADPLAVPRLVLDTAADPDERIARVLAFLGVTA